MSMRVARCVGAWVRGRYGSYTQCSRVWRSRLLVCARACMRSTQSATEHAKYSLWPCPKRHTCGCWRDAARPTGKLPSITYSRTSHARVMSRVTRVISHRHAYVYACMYVTCSSRKRPPPQHVHINTRSVRPESPPVDERGSWLTNANP